MQSEDGGSRTTFLDHAPSSGTSPPLKCGTFKGSLREEEEPPRAGEATQDEGKRAEAYHALIRDRTVTFLRLAQAWDRLDVEEAQGCDLRAEGEDPPSGGNMRMFSLDLLRSMEGSRTPAGARVQRRSDR